MGSIQFAVSFRDTYGIIHPDFFPGTLEQAFKEACNKPAKDVRIFISEDVCSSILRFEKC